MKKILSNLFCSLMMLTTMIYFVACSEDSTNNWENESENSSQITSYDDLPNCSKNRENEIITVFEEGKIYFCQDGRWEFLHNIPDTVKTEDVLSACLKKNEDKIAFISKDSTIWECKDKRWKNLGKAYESTDNLPNCTNKRKGLVVYIFLDKESLTCSDGKWEKTDNDETIQKDETKDEIKSSSSIKNKSSSSSKKNSSDAHNSEESTSASKDSLSSSKENLTSSSSQTSDSTKDKSTSSAAQSSAQNESQIKYGTLIDERDGQEYKTVKIGNQTWMAENLNFDYKINGKSHGSYCYEDEPDSCAIYGRLYTWATAMDSAALFSNDGKGCGGVVGENFLCEAENAQGICPENWHLSTFDDWETLLTEISGESSFFSTDASTQKAILSATASSLKATTKWHDEIKGTDKYGFSILPSGGWYFNFWLGKEYYGDGYWGNGGIAFFWIGYEFGLEESHRIQVQDSSLWILSDGSPESAYSVRCVKDIHKAEAQTLHINVPYGKVLEFDLPANTITQATLPKCENFIIGGGFIGCTAQPTKFFGLRPNIKIKINDIEVPTPSGIYNFSEDFVSNSCGKTISITSSRDATCNIELW